MKVEILFGITKLFVSLRQDLKILNAWISMMIYKNLNIYYHLKESMNTMSTQ